MIRKTFIAGLLVLTATAVNAEQVRTAKTADLKVGDGAIRGQLVTTSGQIVGHQEVVLKNHLGQVVARNSADAQGRFAVGPVQPGAYQLQVATQVLPVRVWTHQSAPPTAGTSLLFPLGTTVRGQLLGQNLGLNGGAGLGVGVCVVGATIGTVIAVTTSTHSGS